MTPKPTKEVQVLRARIRGTCATVKLVCEMRELTYQGAMLHSGVVERMIREQLQTVQELEDEGADLEHVEAIRSLIDELGGAEELLRQKVLVLARIEGPASG